MCICIFAFMYICIHVFLYMYICVYVIWYYAIGFIVLYCGVTNSMRSPYMMWQYNFCLVIPLSYARP